MSILNTEDMSEVLASIDAGPNGMHDSNESERTPLTHDQLIELLVKERDFYKDESHEDKEALRIILALCKEKGINPFGEGSEPLQKPISMMTKGELHARNEEATARIQKNRHVTSPDQIPMPTAEEQAKLYQHNPNVDLVMELMEKSKIAEKARIEAKAPKRPWWKMIFASCKNPYDPYAE